MTVILVGEHPDSPSGNFDKDKWVFVRKFKVITDDYNDGPFVICNATDLPDYYGTYEFGNESVDQAVCKSMVPKRIAPNSLVWEVEMTWETPSNDDKNDRTDKNTDPTFDIPTVSITWENYQQAALDATDPNQEPITASTGEPFIPAVTSDRARMILSIKRNEYVTAPHPGVGALFIDTINSGTFWGFKKHQVKCQGVAVEGPKIRQTGSQAIAYLEVTYNFSCYGGANTWDAVLLDAGSYYYNADGSTSAFITKDGHEYIGLLDGNGGAIPNQQTATPIFLPPIQIYFESDFSLLNLPQSFPEVNIIPT